ncbi:MAG TPA: ROK family protein [Micromonosporaceae bacterium]
MGQIGDSPRPPVAIAVDVGGTSIKGALIDPAGTVRHTARFPTRAERGPDAVVDTVVEAGSELAGTARDLGFAPVAVGVAVPGVVDEEQGVAVWSANLGLRQVPLRDLVAERLGVPTALGHDVRAGGLAEARLGAARGARHVLFVAIGTGIAGVHLVGGRGHAGAHGAAGEIGHVVVRPGGPGCGCGTRGCLEAVASAAAVGRAYTTRTGRPATAAEVAARAANGEPDAVEVWREAVDALADGLLVGLTMLDPSVVVLGGGLAEAGDLLLTPLRRAVEARLTFQRMPELVRAELGDRAGCLGAGLLALSLIEEER